MPSHRTTALNARGNKVALTAAVPHGGSPTLAEIGREAQRVALLATLKDQEWNLTATARVLGLTGASNVIRSLKNLGLESEYEAARDRGDIRAGRGDVR